MPPISRADLLKELLPGLEKLFGMEYEKHKPEFTGAEYIVRSRYGKYTIYKWDIEKGIRVRSTTLAKALSKHEAIGMMKLLREPN